MTKFKVIAMATVCAALVMSSAGMAAANQNGQGKGHGNKNGSYLTQPWTQSQYQYQVQPQVQTRFQTQQAKGKTKGGAEKKSWYGLPGGKIKAPGVYREGQLLIPVNAVTTGLGAAVTCDGNTVRIEKDGRYIVIDLNSNSVVINGTTLDLCRINKGKGRLVLSPGLLSKFWGAAQSDTTPSLIAEDISMAVGEEKEFTVSVTNPEGGSDYDNVRGKITIPNARLSDIDSLQYLDGSTWRDVQLTQSGTSVTGCYGSGFAMPADYSDTTDFRLKMDNQGTYNLDIRLVDLDNGQRVIARDTMTADVDSESGGDVEVTAGDLTLERGVEKQFSIVAENPGGNSDYDSLRYKFILENADLDNVAILRYKDGDTWRNVPLSESGGDVVGYIGDSSGFSLPDNTAKTTVLRLKMSAGGDYRAEVRLVDLENDDQTVASDSFDISVDNNYDEASVEVPDLTLDAGVEREFTMGLTNPGDGRDYDSVRVRFTVEDARVNYIPAFRYKDGSSWRNISLSQSGNDVIGYYGSSSGFSLPEDYDRDITFSLNMARVGAYNVRVELLDLDNDQDVIADHNMTVKVR